MRSLETSSITSHTHTTVIKYEQLFNDHCVETQLTQYQLRDILGVQEKKFSVFAHFPSHLANTELGDFWGISDK